MPTQKLTHDILLAAIDGFESQKRRIDLQVAELRQMLTGAPQETAATPEVPKGERRKLSAAARARIGDAQRKRWAAAKKESEPSPVAQEAPKPKRKLSAAGKRAIVEATKKRWAVFHAAKEGKKPAVAKKAAPRKAAVKKVATKKTAAKKATAKKGPLKTAKKVAAKETQKKAATAPEQTAPAAQ